MKRLKVLQALGGTPDSEEGGEMRITFNTDNPVFQGVLTALVIAMTMGFLTLVRSELVVASDLDVVVETVDKLGNKVDSLADSVHKLSKAQIRSDIFYFKDRIRELDDKQRTVGLTPGEQVRLDQYKDNLQEVEDLLKDAEKSGVLAR